MNKLEKGQQYRISSDGALLTIEEVDIPNDKAYCTILRNNQTKSDWLNLSTIKSEIGKGRLTIVTPHQAKVNTTEEQPRQIGLRTEADDASEPWSNNWRGAIVKAEKEQPEAKPFPKPDTNFDYENGKWIEPGAHDPAKMFESSTIKVKETLPYEGFYSDPNGDRYFRDERGNIYVQQGDEWFICTPSGEADYPIHNKIVIEESRFGRILGKFHDYTSKVISVLKRNGVDENSDLDLSTIINCYGQGMNSRDCANVYLKTLGTAKRMNEAAEPQEVSLGIGKKVRNGYGFFYSFAKMYPLLSTPTKKNVDALSQKLGITWLKGIIYSVDQWKTNAGISRKKSPAKSFVLLGKNPQGTFFMYDRRETAFAGSGTTKLHTIKGSIGILDAMKYKVSDIYQMLHIDKQGRLTENKQMKNKEQLNETSFVFNNTPKFILNYEDTDVVKGIRELFKNYDGFTCNKIAAVGETQFYNIDITADTDEDYKDMESKRFMISQKIHKFRAEFFTDMSSIFPVVNINMGNYEFTKNADKIKFSLTILMSATNQRDWVSGEYKQKDKKLGQKIIDSLEQKELNEGTMNDKLKDLLG
jgi:hypothetical protein